MATQKSRTAESGDSWARIAKQEYGAKRQAQALAQANGAESSLRLRGQQVMRPDLSGASFAQMSTPAPTALAPLPPAPQAPVQQEVDEGATCAALGDANPMM